MRLRSLFLLLPVSAAFATTPGAWPSELLMARAEKDQAFKTGPTSPLAGVQRLTVEAGEPAGLREQGGAVALGTAAGATAVVLRDQGAWRLRLGSSERPLGAGDVFPIGRFHVQAQVSRERVVLLVFDPQAPALKAFKGLRYYAPSRDFVVEADAEPVERAQPITLATTRQLRKAFTPYARLHFRLDGRPMALTAYRSGGEDTLFIPFTDATTGKDTYAVGRFLEVPLPPGRILTLDFNQAYNPLCNYSGIWNCPIPPEENALPIPIRAGERTYPAH